MITKAAVVVSEGICYDGYAYGSADPTRRNPAAGLRRLACHAEHAVQVEFLELVYLVRQEEDQAPARFHPVHKAKYCVKTTRKYGLVSDIYTS
jgi:hypothetical protein